MKRVLGGMLLFVSLLIFGIGGIIVTDSVFPLIVFLAKPSHGFDLSYKAVAPDYDDSVYWAALPEIEDPSDLQPPGEDTWEFRGQVDVFFVYPTTYMKGGDWNWDLKLGSGTEENVELVLANQASVYNAVGDVFAPHYRQSSILSYLVGEPERSRALEFAYQDVESAFDHFVTHRSGNRPFILASHSQGTHHLEVLLRQRISGTLLLDRLIAAYIIGGGTPEAAFDDHADLRVCQSSTDIGCIIHWATWKEGVPVRKEVWNHDDRIICVNPLTWRQDEIRADRELGHGALPFAGTLNSNLFGDDERLNPAPSGLDATIAQHTWAACKDGMLFVADQSKSVFAGLDLFGNYHNMDYNLFYSDIRSNVIERAEAYLNRSDPFVSTRP